jgi:hypothetical protein
MKLFKVALVLVLVVAVFSVGMVFGLWMENSGQPELVAPSPDSCEGWLEEMWDKVFPNRPNTEKYRPHLEETLECLAPLHEAPTSVGAS